MIAADEVRSYIQAQHGTGMASSAIVDDLLRMGWHPGSIDRAINDALGEPAMQSSRPRLPDGHATRLQLGDRTLLVQARWQRPDACLLSGFLDAAECAEIIGLAEPLLRRSQVRVGDGHAAAGSVTLYARTSEQAWVAPGQSNIVDRIQARVADLTHWPAGWMEHLQVVRYGVGADFSPHHDFFPASDRAEGQGQRVATLIMYLNTPAQGGATSFPDIEMEIYPQQGNALYFAYPCATADSLTLHAGVPLAAGEKWIATFFLRDGAWEGR
ncbi:prolyl hydroxylase family protein [Stenotrophomonas maltophilia]|uniref:prolyl hydroxylase family protein n=1 Tax=Stenotrophomonas maltophilia TaxID=40324 RepID=UPI003B9DEAAE